MDASVNDFPKQKLVEPGLHFALPEDVYHADPALGSGDIRTLAVSPYDYWYTSDMNPMRPKVSEKDHLVRGRAMHKLIFEGRGAFDNLFIIGPDQEGMSSGEKAASTRAANVAAEKLGRSIIKRDDFNRVMLAAATVTNNPSLAVAFTGGCPEVSFFWTKNGVRLKARFDYLKCTPREESMIVGNGDLKSVANEKRKSFKQACREAVANYRYDAQAAHYMDGLSRVVDAVKKSAVFVHSNDAGVLNDAEMNLVRRLGHKRLKYGWQRIFCQTTGAPATFSYFLSPMSPILEVGQAHVRRGFENYVRCMEMFGTTAAWQIHEPPEELAMEEMPAYYAR